MLDNLKVDPSIKQETDSLGGFILETDAYDMTIKMAYIDTSQSGAYSLNLEVVTGSGQTFKQSLWMTSGTAKGCKNFYLDKNDEKQYLPGFNQANAICLLSIGKNIADTATELKTIKVYDGTQKKEVPMEKQVVMELLNQPITLAIEKQTVDKTAKNKTTGNYDPTGETRNQNEISKVFRTRDHLTVVEITGGATEASDDSFYHKWLAKNKGKTVNKAKGVKEGTGTQAPITDTGAPKTNSMFQ